MDLKTILNHIDSETARAFVTAARHVIDALLIERQRIRATPTPPAREYPTAELPRGTPPAGWLSDEELRETARRLAEAMALEKWTDGLICALRLLAALGGAL